MNFPTIIIGTADITGAILDAPKVANTMTHPAPTPALTPAPTIIKFEVGALYFCRSICDYDCIYRFRVIKRTEKTVTISAFYGTDSDGADRLDTAVRRKIITDTYDGAENISPHGSYSMSPILSAHKLMKIT